MASSSWTHFWDLYREGEGTIDVEMRQEYLAGEKLLVDYAGQTMSVVNRETGEVREAQVFVGTSGASNYIYTEATWTHAVLSHGLQKDDRVPEIDIDRALFRKGLFVADQVKHTYED